MRRLVVVAWMTLIAGSVADLLGGQPAPVQRIRGGALDDIQLYVKELPAPPLAVVIRLFSATDADLGTGGSEGRKERQEEATMIQDQGPKMLATRFVSKLQELGPFKDVTVGARDAKPVAGGLLVEGKFTKIDPGSRAKRYFVGFGAGKSTVEVKGSVLGPDGATLATFAHKRHGSMGMGGGDSLEKLSSDSRSIGEDIAEFLSKWANRKSLK